MPTGTDRTDYELCVGPHGSGTRNHNGSLLLNFARCRRLRIAGSWYQRPELHRWTWYSNAGGVAKEIDHILVSTRWRILQNCRVFRSAEFFATDHRLVVATLKLHIRSRRISRCNTPVFHLDPAGSGRPRTWGGCLFTFHLSSTSIRSIRLQSFGRPRWNKWEIRNRSIRFIFYGKHTDDFDYKFFDRRNFERPDIMDTWWILVLSPSIHHPQVSALSVYSPLFVRGG